MKYDIDDIIRGNTSYSNKIERLKEILKENNKEIKSLSDENIRLNQNYDVIIRKSINSQNDSFLTKEKTPKNIKQIDISYYIEYLKCSESEDDLEIFMPNVHDNNFEDIYANIMLYLQKELIVKNKLVISNLTGDELLKVKKDIEKISLMMDLVTSYKEKYFDTGFDEILFEKENKSPILVYSKTMSGNVALLRDLKKEPFESYDDFLYLFEALSNGDFKNVKRITKTNDNSLYSSILEVKLNSARITFEKLNGNVCLVTGAFVKKVMKSSIYKTKLISIARNAQMSRKYILENLSNPTFIDEEKKITKDVYRLLRGEE